MLDYLVLYQTESGNTKKIAASIFSRLPGNSKDLIDIDTDKTIPEANVYFIGFCVHRGSCSMEVSDFLSDLSGKQIALFGTCGMGDSPEYYKDIAGRVSAWIEADNDYLGYFICQGKMMLRIKKQMQKLWQKNMTYRLQSWQAEKTLTWEEQSEKSGFPIKQIMKMKTIIR